MQLFIITILVCLLFVFVLTIIEILVLLSEKSAQELPTRQEQDAYANSINGKTFEDLYHFLSDASEHISFSDTEVFALLKKQCDYMNKRFDCADFRAQLLFKIYKDCANKLDEDSRALIRDTFLGFKYFMDEPGDDSMCYWSENHQILFAVSEYLAGQEWQDEVFANNGMTGAQHMQKAKDRIDAWMDQRFRFGFSEYLSNNYLAEDIAPMANYIAYSKDERSVEQMKIIMDLLWLDVALNSVNNRFVSTSSRMYGNNKAGNYYGNSIQAAMNLLWGNDLADRILADAYLSDRERDAIKASLDKKANHIVLCFTDIVKKGIYSLPKAIYDIALETQPFVSQMSCGLSAEDMKKEGLIGCQPHQIMAQMGAETFTDYRVIDNTLAYLKANKMYRNSFVSYFKFLNLSVFKFMNWRKFAQKHNIMPHGIATGRGNVYTYRTSRYCLSTSVCKDVDMCGAQEHIWSANIGETLSLFTTHPAGDGKSRFNSSPGYWIGNGRRPMSVQHENVNITVYRIPDKKRLGEAAVSNITHACMPKDFYDSFELSDNMVLARKNGVFVALLSNGKLQYKPFDPASANGIHKGRKFPDACTLQSEFDLCRTDGKYHIYITELSDADKESFECFKERIKKNFVHFSLGGSVQYKTENTTLSVSYDGAFSVNGKPTEMQYLRYNSKFCKAERNAGTVHVDSGKNSLVLNLQKAIREQ